MSDETVDMVRKAFQRSPQKSTRRASRETGIPQSTIVKILHNRLYFHAYKVQTLQALIAEDKPKRAEFATLMLEWIDANNDYLNKICFSDEATFHTFGNINRHNVRIWGSENPHVVLQHIRDSSKVNVCYGLIHNKIIGPFFFNEPPTTATVYLDMLEGYITPQLKVFQPWILFQQDGAPPHWGLIVRTFLDEIFPDRWIGRDGPTPWPPRSPDITHLDFFLWGYVEDQVFSLPVPDMHTLKVRIWHAVETVTEEMLENTWREIEYRLDVLRATNGAHIEVYP